MLRKLYFLIKAEWQSSLTYRSMLAVWMFGLFFMPFLMLTIWLSILGEGGAGPFSRRMFITYYLALPFVANFTGAWAGFYLPRKIREGDLSLRLLQPLHPIYLDLANNLAEKFTKTWFLIPMVLAAAALYGVEPIFFSAGQLVLASSSILAGLLIHFLLDWLLGLLGFWLADPQPLTYINTAFLYFFGGRILPLSLFPEKLRLAADLLPYRYISSLPLEILSGGEPAPSLFFSLAGQGFWLLVFLAALVFVWRRGLRRYEAYGG
jgi:ABC-2 type transport system permease protein